MNSTPILQMDRFLIVVFYFAVIKYIYEKNSNTVLEFFIIITTKKIW